MEQTALSKYLDTVLDYECPLVSKYEARNTRDSPSVVMEQTEGERQRKEIYI
jgi:hypothetical protein